jgi:hypothetical protein
MRPFVASGPSVDSESGSSVLKHGGKDLSRMRSTLKPVVTVVRADVALLGLSMCFLLAGCQTLGPAALGVGRGAYNDVIARTSSEQTLGLIVRLRYSDPVGLLMVSSVTAGLKFSTEAKGEAGFGPRANYAGNLVPFSAGVGYEDSPTISYTPVDGQAFLREWLAPVTLETLALVNAGGRASRQADLAPSRTREWTAQ